MNRLAFTITISLLLALLGGKSFGQDLLKQLEEKLRLKNPIGETSPPKADEPTSDETTIEADGVVTDTEELPLPESKGTQSSPPKPATPSRLPPGLAPLEKLAPANPFPGSIGNKSNAKNTNRSSTSPPKANLPRESLLSQEPDTSDEVGGGGYLGMTLEPAPGGGFGLSVVEVTPQSPAWKGGFRVGDRVIGVAGQAVATIEQFAKEIEKFTPGTPVKFSVQRNGKGTSLVAVPQDRTLAGQIHGAVPGTALPLNPPIANNDPNGGLGVSVSDLSQAFRRQFGIAAYRGASVTDVGTGSPAAVAGIRPGDCIVEVDGKVIQSANALVDAIRTSNSGQPVTVAYYRGRQLNTTAVYLTPGVSGNNGLAVRPDMLTPEYVTSLHDEVSRLQSELQQTQSKLRELEAKLQNVDRNRR